MSRLRALVDRLRRKPRPPTFEAFRGPSGQWFCRERASNGEIVSISESYASRTNSVRAAKSRAARVVGSAWKVIEASET